MPNMDKIEKVTVIHLTSCTRFYPSDSSKTELDFSETGGFCASALLAILGIYFVSDRIKKEVRKRGHTGPFFVLPFFYTVTHHIMVIISTI